MNKNFLCSEFVFDIDSIIELNICYKLKHVINYCLLFF